MSDRVPLLEKALTILEIIGSDSNPLTINQIAKLSGIPLSSLYRVMNTLTELGFVNKDPTTRTYSLGLKLLYLGNQVKRQLPLIKVVRPFLEELTEKTGETSNLVMEENGEAVYVERVDTQNPLRITHMIGRKAPMYATGVGKCLLAWKDTQEIIRIVNKTGMHKLTPNTITNLNDLLEELRRVKERGYALDMEECEIGIRCISAPIFLGDEVIAAISISGPSVRLTDEKILEYIPLVCKASQDISNILKGENIKKEELILR
jgi:DNA-binding IclR family transcriptional regulator